MDADKTEKYRRQLMLLGRIEFCGAISAGRMNLVSKLSCLNIFPVNLDQCRSTAVTLKTCSQ